MTIATRAPVIMPSMATPNRISNQPMIAPAGRRDEGRVALAEHGRDPPVERVEDRLERPRLLDERDEHRGDEHERDDALGEREEEPPVELTADAPDVPRDAADERRDEDRQGQRRTSKHRGR